MDAERASRHRTDTIETESCGGCVLLTVQIQHVPCEACYTARARACEESVFVMTSKHVVDKLILPGKPTLSHPSTALCSAWVIATSIVLLLMTEEFSAALVSLGAAAVHVTRPSQFFFGRGRRLVTNFDCTDSLIDEVDT